VPRLVSQLKTEVHADRLALTADAEVAASLMDAVLQPVRDAAAQTQCTNNEKQIALAIHNYISSTRPKAMFPPAYTTSKDGKPLLSWRVLILPYLEQEALYKQFHLDEPWDSPHNRPLIARMPEVFETPDSPSRPGTTRIRGFAGPGAMFEVRRRVQIADVTDGASNTIMIATGRDAVPWTKPDELDVAPGQPVPALDLDDDKGALVGIADGSVRTIPASPVLLSKLITRAGGEVIDWSLVPPVHRGHEPAPSPTPAPLPTATATAPVTPTPAPASTIPPELDQRLRGIEDKLDRLIRKLDAAGEGAGRP
jgi:hypothetical protein